MQMRFDGFLGFPGGLVDDDDASLEAALQRELSEELGIEKNMITFSEKDYLYSFTFKEKNVCLHFFTKELTLENLRHVEKCEAVQRNSDLEVM